MPQFTGLRVENDMQAEPVVKWAGGKRQILAHIRRRLPKKIATYYEPFVGGGAVFFALANRNVFERAVIADVNQELIDTYSLLSEGRVEELVQVLGTYQNNREFFNQLRAVKPTELSQVLRVARFLFLNKTGFNGLYRVNGSGGFNVPFGDYANPNFCDAPRFREASRALRGTTIKCLDYESVVADAKPGDTIYFDPPYLPKSDTANFTAYTDKGFGIQEHTRLARVFKEKADAGVSVLLSNSDTKISRELYKGFRISRVQAVRSINSDGDKRGPIGELLISANL
jgi:DNA adenine methylase